MVKICTATPKETTMDTPAWMFTFTPQIFNDFVLNCFFAHREKTVFCLIFSYVIFDCTLTAF